MINAAEARNLIESATPHTIVNSILEAAQAEIIKAASKKRSWIEVEGAWLPGAEGIEANDLLISRFKELGYETTYHGDIVVRW